MELAYLGLFSKIFNWVMDKIFDPVFKFISDLLSTVLSWVFNEILAPILFPILEEVLEFAIDLYKTIYSFQIYSLFAGVLKLIDYLEIAFDVFIGRSDVMYTTDSGEKISGTLLEILVQHEMVMTVFWALTLGGIGIALMLTIFGTAKSAFDLDFENKRPVSKVLTAMMKCFIQFFMVPLFVYFMLIIATDILNITIDAISGGVDTTLGRIIFMIASLNASRTKGLNADYLNTNGNPQGIVLGTSPDDYVRYPFYIKNTVVNGNKTITPIDYINVKAVNNSFNLADFDYLIGFLAAIFLLFVMAVCIVTFVQRIFEVVLLFIVSPYFVSTMPLDDGERFGRWRDLFIGKCFTGFGSAIGMRLYLAVCQMIMGGSIRFTAEELGSSIEIDYFMKLFFLLGGAWAVFKSGPMITTLLSSGAGQQESMTQAAVGGTLYGHTIGKAMHAGRGALVSAFRGKGGAGALARDRKAKNSDPNQKFAGAKGDRMAKVAQANGLKKKTGIDPLAKSKGNPFNSKDKSVLTSKKDPKISGGSVTAKTSAVRVQTSKKSMAGSSIAAKTASRSAQDRHNFRLGSFMQSTYDDNGNHKIRVLGFGVDRDASGNTMAFKMPIMNMKLQRTEPDQKMQLARLNVPGITRINSNVQNGSLKYSDISILGGMARIQNDGSDSKIRVLGGLTDVTRGKSGSHVSVLGGVVQHSTTDEGTHIGVAGIHRYNSSEGTTTRIGSLNVQSGLHGSTVNLGSGISFKSSGDHLQSMKLGSLEYTRSGVRKDVGSVTTSSAVSSGGTTQTKYTPPRPTGPAPRPSKLTTTVKPGSGSKPGGK